MTTSIVIISGETCNRDGTKENVDAIEETFQKKFNSEVFNWIDTPPVELRKKIRELKTKQEWLDKFKQCNFIAIFCLAHGVSDGQICLHQGEDKKEINSIKTTFLNPLIKIAELNGKLKWLIIQSCRGNLNDLTKMQTDGEFEKVPYLDYYLISYCTGEGTLSAQGDKCGKVYVHEICRELDKNAETKTLMEMLLNVNDAVKAYGIDNNCENFSRPVIETNCPDHYRLTE